MVSLTIRASENLGDFDSVVVLATVEIEHCRHHIEVIGQFAVCKDNPALGFRMEVRKPLCCSE